MFITYILQSINYKRHYIGHTEDIEIRLKRHNTGKVKATKNYLPWKVIHVEKFKTRSEAYNRERQIKSYKGGKAFSKLFNK